MEAGLSPGTISPRAPVNKGTKVSLTQPNGADSAASSLAGCHFSRDVVSRLAMFPDAAPGRTSSTPLRLGAIYRSMDICEQKGEKRVWNMAETPCKRWTSITKRPSGKQRLGRQKEPTGHRKRRVRRQGGPVTRGHNSRQFLIASSAVTDPTGYSVSDDGYSGWG